MNGIQRTIISTTVGENPLEEWTGPHSQQNKVQNAALGCNLKKDTVISYSFPRQTIQNHSSPSLCPKQWYQRSWSWPVLRRPMTLSRTNTQKRCLFLDRGSEFKRRKSWDTWSKRQVWPRNTKQSRTKANRVLPREHTGHGKHLLPTRQETTLHMDITRWLIPTSDWLCSFQPKMEKLYRVSKNKILCWLTQIMSFLLKNSDLS